MDVLDFTIRRQQTMLDVKICLLIVHALEGLAHEIPIVGMNSLERQFQCWVDGSIVFKDVVSFLRPVDLTADNAPAETARVA